VSSRARDAEERSRAASVAGGAVGFGEQEGVI
jgi:hypothetical protein